MAEVILYNPREGSDVTNFRWADSVWEDLKVNEMRAYPDYVADELLKRYGFLREVRPEDVSEIKELINSEIFDCPVRGCNYSTTDKKKLHGHMLGKHKMTDEAKKILKSVPKAEGKTVVRRGQKKMTPEQMEGIPNTKKGEVDGWYGEGLENDNPGGMGVSRPGQPGHFGSA